jgi:hypothetical protein
MWDLQLQTPFRKMDSRFKAGTEIPDLKVHEKLFN